MVSRKIRHNGLLLLLTFLGITLSGFANACDCPEFPNIYRLQIPAILLEKGRLERLRPGTNEYERIGTVLVLQSWKGAKKGDRIEVTYSNGDSCESDFPKIGPISKQTFILGTKTYRSGECITFPSGIEGEHLITDYYKTWMQLQKQTEQNPKDLSSHLALAEHLDKWEDLKGAKAAYSQALKISPTNFKAQVGLANQLVCLGKFSEAKQIFEKALKSDPNNGKSFIMLQKIAFKERHDKIIRSSENSENTKKLGYCYISASNWPPLREASVSENARDRDFSEKDFSELDIQNVSLSIPNLTAPRSKWFKASIHSIELKQIDLTEAMLSDASFIGVTMDGARLDKADARGTSFVESQLVLATARNFDGRRANFTKSDLSGADFSNSNLADAIFKEADLKLADFTEANLDNTNMSTADLRGVNFTNASLNNVELAFARVDCQTKFPEGFNIRAHKLIPTEPCEKPFSRDFRNVNLAKISFERTDLRNFQFENSTMDGGTSFDKTDISGVNFSGAKLEKASFRNVLAKNAIFREVSGFPSLKLSDFSGAQLSGLPPEADNRFSLRVETGEEGPLLTGAHIENASIYLSSRDRNDHDDKRALSVLDATIKNSTIICGSAPMHSGYDAKSDMYEWHRFIRSLDIARKLGAKNPTIALSSSCAQLIEVYLGDNCRVGLERSKVKYDCPAAQ